MQKLLSTQFYCFTQTEIDGSLILTPNIGRFIIVEALNASHANHLMTEITKGHHRHSDVYGDRFDIEATESDALTEVGLPSDAVFHPFLLEEVDDLHPEWKPEEIVVVHPLGEDRTTYMLRILPVPSPKDVETQLRDFSEEYQTLVGAFLNASDEDDVIELLNRYDDYCRRYNPVHEALVHRIENSYSTASSASPSDDSPSSRRKRR